MTNTAPQSSLINTLSAKLAKMSTLTIALWASIVIHATILAIKFQPELKKMANQLPSLDVVLVNTKTKSAPDKADLIAQANLDRGGNTEANRHMKTALPAPQQKTTEVKLRPSVEAKAAAKASMIQAKEAREQKRLAELEKQAQELMTQLKSTKEVASKPTQLATAADPEKGDQKALTKPLSHDALLATALEMERLEAQIAKEQEEYQKRPKRRFLGSRTKEASDAMYLESWRQKVERIGNMNYPAAARDRKIYGKLQLTVSIKADGSVDTIEVNKSSGSKILDEAAMNIVRLSAPFSVFPPEMRKTTDILSITRTWTFTQEDMLNTGN